MIRRVVGLWLRWNAKHARLYAGGSGRMLCGWCDYGSHERVYWVATVGGRDWGQACFRHAGALAIDAMEVGGSTIRPVGVGGRDRVIRLD